MAEFDYFFISILFGLAGTLILLLSNIFSYKNNIKNREKFSLISQLIGFLFLFNSFLYQLFPKIASWDLISRYPPITEFSYWPYYLFILAGILISLFLVREEDFGWNLEVSISPKSNIEFGILFSIPVLAIIVFFLNNDFFLIIDLFAWAKFMQLLWKRN